MRIFDVFPFFNEADILEIRLNELSAVVDYFVIIEAGETYGGAAKPYNLLPLLSTRFAEFLPRIIYIQQHRLFPPCTDRTSGRLREAYQRDGAYGALDRLVQDDDIIIFSDCDEIPRADAVARHIFMGPVKESIYRFAAHSFYYNVNTLVDYGHDFACRARIGTARQLREVGSMMGFRMFEKNSAPIIENGAWHFSYFGGPSTIKTKVKALAPFLAEYRLFGDEQLSLDIAERRDLHHRKCEMPSVFWEVDMQDLPRYLLSNRNKFPHFFKGTVQA